MSDILDVSISNENVMPIDISATSDDVFGLSIGENISYENDYKKLINKPSINGTVLEGNIDEIDPTIPQWAKEPVKPNYTPDEVSAVPSTSNISVEELAQIFNI